jgi:IK cytokine
MNNQAFRKLVYQQTSKTINKSSDHHNQPTSKSNKEIAREAVQQEFNELKRKRKFGSGGHGDAGRSGGGGGFFDGDFDMSDDDDNDGYDNNLNERNNSEKNEDKNSHDNDKGNNYAKGQRKKYKSGRSNNQDGMKQSQQSKYRDRAKERREGKNLDYLEAERLNLPSSSNNENLTLEQGNMHTQNNSALSEMTKFLGGDEQFTHLVKGLDKTLADKVRREEMTMQYHDGHITTSTTVADGTIPIRQNDNNIDLDQIMEDAQALKVKKRSEKSPNDINTIIEAKKSSSSTLVSTMASYLQTLVSRRLTSKYSTSPSTSATTTSSIYDTMQTSMHNSELNTAGQTIHRSTLTFSLTNLKRQHAWEIPNTSINASARHPVIPSPCTPVDRELITKIKFALDAISTLKKKQVDEEASRNKQKEKEKHSDKDIITNGKINYHQDDDSDDDIYDDVGDYIPPSIDARKINN